MKDQFTAEAQRTPRFHREEKREFSLSLPLFPHMFSIILPLRDLCVLCASAVKATLSIITRF
jgi:hypothetical protein